MLSQWCLFLSVWFMGCRSSPWGVCKPAFDPWNACPLSMSSVPTSRNVFWWFPMLVDLCVLSSLSLSFIFVLFKVSPSHHHYHAAAFYRAMHHVLPIWMFRTLRFTELPVFMRVCDCACVSTCACGCAYGLRTRACVRI